MRVLKGKDDLDSKNKLKEVVKEVAEKADENFEKLKSELENIKSDSGKLDANKLCKFRKKVCPKSCDPPTAMMDKHGDILTSDDAISNRALEVYSESLSNNNIPSHFADYEKDVNTLCEIRLKI